jgi:hypothetical protein
MSFSPLTKFNVLTTRPIDNTDDLVGWFTFDDGTAQDWSGAGNSGHSAGTVVPIPVAGIIGNAVSFNGSTQWFDCTFSNFGPKPFTVACWVNPVSGAGNNAFVASGNSSGGIEFGVNNTAGTLLLNRASIVNLGNSTGILTYGVWSHIAVTYTAAGVFTFYINGVSAGSGTNNQTFSTGVLQIGSCANGDKAHGSLDDLRIYNRVLTPGEINAIYNQGLAFQQGQPEGEMPVARSTSISASFNLVAARVTGAVAGFKPTDQRVLSGVAGTAAVESLKPSVSKLLGTAAATGAVEALSRQDQRSLTGVAATSVAEALKPSLSKAVGTAAATGAAEALGPKISVTLAGTAATAAVGNLTRANVRALAAAAATGSVGTLLSSIDVGMGVARVGGNAEAFTIPTPPVPGSAANPPTNFRFGHMGHRR